jgi:hypothetical protein
MPINSDKSKITLDFEYENEKIKYLVKYHHTDDFGPTVSLSEEGTNSVSFPAEMFSEITDFLREQKHLRYPKIEVRQKETVEKTLPIPEIQIEEDDKKIDMINEDSKGEIKEFESFDIETKTVKEQEEINTQVKKQPINIEAKEVDSKEFIEERRNAAEKAKLSQKKIKRLDNIEE